MTGILRVLQEMDRIIYRYEAHGYIQHYFLEYVEELLMLAKGRNDVMTFSEHTQDLAEKTGTFEIRIAKADGNRAIYRVNFDFKQLTFSVRRNNEIIYTDENGRVEIIQKATKGSVEVVFHNLKNLDMVSHEYIVALARNDIRKLIPDKADIKPKRKRGPYKKTLEKELQRA